MIAVTSVASETSSAYDPLDIERPPIVGKAGNNISFELKPYYTTATFTGTGDSYDYGSEERLWALNSVATVVIGEGITSIGEGMFSGMLNLKNVNLPSTLKRIGDSAFSTTAIESIIIPDGTESIGTLALSGCPLTDINVPDSVTHIGSSAFSKCRALKTVKLGNGISEINQGLLSSTESLEYLEIGNGVTHIKRWFLNGSGLKALHIPANVVQISYGAFYTSGAGELNSITMSPENTKYHVSADGKILYNKEGDELVRCLPSMTADKFTVPGTVTSIAPYAFCHCVGIGSIAIPEGVEYIGSYAFYGCDALEELKIPDSVTHIENGGINIESPIDLYLGGGIKAIPYKTVPSLSFVRELHIPAGISTIEFAPLWKNSNLRLINVDDDNESFSSFNGSLYNKTLTQLYVVPCNFTGLYKVADSTMFINNYAFHMSKTESVRLGQELRIIGDYAFSESSIRSIRIPASVVLIGDGAFFDCTNLEKIYFESGNKPSICEKAFLLDRSYPDKDIRVYSSFESGFLDYYSAGTVFTYTSTDLKKESLTDILTNPLYTLAISTSVVIMIIIIRFINDKWRRST